MVTFRAVLLAAALVPAAFAAPPPPAKPAVVVQSAPAPERRQDSLPQFELALKAGGHFPEVWNKLGPSYDFVLKLGWAPLEDRRLQTFLEAGYANPQKKSSGTDQRYKKSVELCCN